MKSRGVFGRSSNFEPLFIHYSLERGLACLSSPLSYPASSALSLIFIYALGREVAQLVGNASQQRLEISEHARREVNASSQHAGEGKFGLVRMKAVSRPEAARPETAHDQTRQTYTNR